MHDKRWNQLSRAFKMNNQCIQIKWFVKEKVVGFQS